MPAEHDTTVQELVRACDALLDMRVVVTRGLDVCGVKAVSVEEFLEMTALVVGAVRCHLATELPPGGDPSDEWPTAPAPVVEATP
jgi:hypothetical protein